jgi:hypothetical protein
MIFDIEHYETNYELLDSIIIESVKRDYSTHVLYSLPIKNIYKNDVIAVSSEFEVTQNNNYMAMIGSYLVITDKPYLTEGDIIVQANGFNLDNKIHHSVPMHFRQFMAKHDYLGTHYLNLIIYSSSTDAHKNDILLIEKNYGHLDAIVYKYGEN